MTRISGGYDIVFGIDFGTIDSGYLIAHLKTDLSPEKSDGYLWKYKEEPSTLFYKGKSKKVFKFGELAVYESKEYPNSGYYLTRIKLLLDKTIESQASLPPHLTPVKVVSDYLSKMNMSIQRQIRLYNKDNNDKWRYCITLPTMWSEQSKAIMREAAVLGGLVKKDDEPDKLLFVDEAVAAGLYADHVSPELGLTNHSIYLVCDAGGGTVDIGVFEKDDSSGQNGLKEITIGTGGSCGSVSLDTRFEALLKSRASKYPGYSERSIEKASRYFNYKLKYIFDGSLKKTTYYISLINQEYISGHPDLKQESISLDEIRTEVFDPVVNEILEMIERQLGQISRLDAMFITGGFIQSPYLQRRVKETFGSRVNSLKFIEYGYEAAMRGAVLLASNPQRAIRTLRHTYGITLANIDMPESNTRSPNGRFHVFASKGQQITNDIWISRQISWKKKTLPVISLYYNDQDPISECPLDIELLAIFTPLPIGQDEILGEILTISISLGYGETRLKVDIAGKRFKYVGQQKVSI